MKDTRGFSRRIRKGFFLFVCISACLLFAGRAAAEERPAVEEGVSVYSYGDEVPVPAPKAEEAGEENVTIYAYGEEVSLPETEEESKTVDPSGEPVFVPVFYSTKVKKDRVNKKKVQLPVEWVCQYPEYPSGCELTSLTMALNYYGFPVTKYTMANDYFIEKNWTPDFRNHFVGDPSDITGLGCLPPAVVKNANAYLDKQKTDLHAFDYTNYPFESLLNQVAEGYPVLVWTSIDLTEPNYGIRVEVDGEDLIWISQEHCVLLTGYDLKRGVVYVSDPIAGNVEYNMNLFKKRYTQLGYKAVIIKSSIEKMEEDKDIVFWPFNDRFLAADKFVRGCKGFDGVFETG